MLIIQKRRAIHVPVALIAIFGPTFVFSIVRSLQTTKPLAFMGPLIVGAVFALVLTQIRWVVADGNKLRVRDPLGQCTLDRTVTIVAVSVHHSARGGASYAVYADDGVRQVSISEHSSAAGSRDAADQLQAWIAEGMPSDAAFAAARDVVRQRAFQTERAKLDAYFDPVRARKTMIFVFVSIVLAVVAFALR